MKSTIQILGIHCQSCVSLISMDLEDLDGVQDISINVETGEAIVEYNEQQISLESIKKTICGSGEYTIE